MWIQGFTHDGKNVGTGKLPHLFLDFSHPIILNLNKASPITVRLTQAFRQVLFLWGWSRLSLIFFFVEFRLYASKPLPKQIWRRKQFAGKNVFIGNKIK
jgi:hypothetical protein